jgi:uncharacterized membrane protein
MNRLNIVLIAFSLMMIFAKVAQDPFLNGLQVVLNDLQISIELVAFLLMMLLVGFFAVLASYSEGKVKPLLLIGCAVLIACVFISLVQFEPDDEMLLSYFAYHSLLAGQNPYAINYITSLKPALAHVGEQGSALLNGSIASYYSYPALYILVQVPFFMLAVPSYNLLGPLGMPLEYIAFFAVLVYAYYLFVKEHHMTLPSYSALMLYCITFLVFSSTVIILALALMTFLYTSWGKRHAWLLLGLLASLQQQMWIFVVLYIAWVYGLKGWRSGLQCAGMAFGVFMLINGYFIALSPSAYFGAFMRVLGLVPDNIAPIGGILEMLGVPSIIMGALVGLSTILLALWLMRGKTLGRWVPLLSAVPYIFIAHALPVYFVLPFAAHSFIQSGVNGQEDA